MPVRGTFALSSRAGEKGSPADPRRWEPNPARAALVVLLLAIMACASFGGASALAAPLHAAPVPARASLASGSLAQGSAARLLGAGGHDAGSGRSGAATPPGSPAPATAQHPQSYPPYLDGVDVSSYQGSINWASANGSVQFVIAKAAEGTDCQDSDFDGNAVNAPANGVYLGAYDFAEIPSGSVQDCPGGTDNATAEAQYFDSIAGPYFTKGYIYPVLDFEQACSAEGDGSYTAKEESHWIGMWMATVQAYILANDNVSIDPIIYMSASYAESCIESWITQFPLWVANWDVSSPSTGLYSSWAFWQYNDDCTTCGSANGGDADYYNGGVTSLLDNYVFGSGTGGGTPPTVSYAMQDLTTSTALTCGASFAAGNNIQFTATVTGGTSPFNYTWSYGDGTTGYNSPATHVYQSPGTVNPTLTVTDAKGKTGTTGSGCDFTVTGTALTATASASPTSGTAPLAVTLTGSAAGGSGTDTYFWNFGDGTPHSTAQSPSHTYSTAGTFVAKLTVNDTAGQTATASATITVSSAPPPSLSVTASASTSSGVAPLAVSFTATPTGGSGGNTFAWTFGDGGKSTAQDPTYTYATAGTFSAQVVVTDSASASATSNSLTIDVSPAASTLAASAAANVTSGYAALSVQFTGTATGGTGSYSSWAWTFGDGQTSSLQDPMHTYVTAGTFHASLVVTDSSGTQATSNSLTITTTWPPGNGLSVTLTAPTAATVGQAASFSAAATGGSGTYSSYSWNFGDGTTTATNTATTTHTYASTGTFDATVTVTDSNEASATSPSEAVAVSAASPTYAVLVGVVYNASNGATIGSATVSILDTSGVQEGPTLTTGANGTFQIALVLGTVAVNVTAAGYRSAQQEVALSAGSPDRVYFNLTVIPRSSTSGSGGSTSGSSGGLGLDWFFSYPGALVLVAIAGIVVVGAAVAIARRRRGPPAESTDFSGGYGGYSGPQNPYWNPYGSPNEGVAPDPMAGVPPGPPR